MIYFRPLAELRFKKNVAHNLLTKIIFPYFLNFNNIFSNKYPMFDLTK